jgi:hypothetical protein
VQQLTGVGGSKWGIAVVTSPDGRHLYTLNALANTVVHYRRREPCAAAPRSDCRRPTAPGAAELTLTERPGTARSAMKLRWTRGTAVTRAELGMPDVSTDYAACLYDASGPQPVASLLAPGGETCQRGPCWQWRAQGFTYLDTDRTPDGVARAIVKPGGEGQSYLRWQANKGAVPPLGLPLDGPVVIQIQASNGTCWEARFSSAIVNDGTRWQGTSD